MTTVTKPYQDFTNNIDVVDAVKINAQYNALYNFLNAANIDLTNMAAAAYSKLATANTLGQRDANGNLVSSFPVTNGQQPNLLFNPSARLGLNGWAASGAGNNWSAAIGGLGEGGYFQASSSAATTAIWILESQKIPIGNGAALNISGEIYTLTQTAGSAYIEVDAFSNADVNLGVVCTSTATNGQGWVKYTGTGTTPANTTYVKVRLVIASGSITGSGVSAFRKVKIETGSYATTFSDDNTLNTQTYGSALGLVQGLSGDYKMQDGQTTVNVPAANTQYTVVVTFPTPFTTAPKGYLTLASAASFTSGYINLVAVCTTTTLTIYIASGVIQNTVTVNWVALGN